MTLELLEVGFEVYTGFRRKHNRMSGLEFTT